MLFLVSGAVYLAIALLGGAAGGRLERRLAVRRWRQPVMSAAATRGVLFDEPGPRGRRRIRIFTVLSVLLLVAGIVALALYQFYRERPARPEPLAARSRSPPTCGSWPTGLQGTLIATGVAARPGVPARGGAGAGAALAQRARCAGSRPATSSCSAHPAAAADLRLPAGAAPVRDQPADLLEARGPDRHGQRRGASPSSSAPASSRWTAASRRPRRRRAARGHGDAVGDPAAGDPAGDPDAGDPAGRAAQGLHARLRRQLPGADEAGADTSPSAPTCWSRPTSSSPRSTWS